KLMTPTYLEAIPLNYRKYGDAGPNLIVLHGLFGSGKNWGSFARSIVNDFQIWMPDTRNHDESPHAETMSYKEMAEDVVCFLDNNGLERIMILGHSMGGNTAMQVALRFPERVS
ncbi:MAG TPA: alpha/beta fold hydrolase, partial [Candidatus Lambdaproteobacteria bacterium]|nr:alpha/beta fold hydrolase [Candidatus Lambdaproteobacteria bacterium]